MNSSKKFWNAIWIEIMLIYLCDLIFQVQETLPTTTTAAPQVYQGNASANLHIKSES